MFRTLLQLRPIIAALRRHKVATLLIVLQVALTLAVTTNALFIVVTRVVHLTRATGTDEARLFVIHNGWTLGQSADEVDAQIRADLATLRGLAGVSDAFSSNDYPLAGARDSGITTRIKLDPQQKKSGEFAMVYSVDDHALDTLGVLLEAGRNFRADEIGRFSPNGKLAPASIIISRSLADKLFPHGDALGSTVYLPNGPSAVVGIVAVLQGPLSYTRASDGDVVLIPALYVDPAGVEYVIRSTGRPLGTVIKTALNALQQQAGVRVLDHRQPATPLWLIREKAYATDRSVALLMTIICTLVLLATAGGIVGLSSFWVSQRRRQIGIRRSLGASRADILTYFHLENFLIVSAGVVLGIALAVAINLGLMVVFYPTPRMPLYAPLLGALLLWLLGQLAVWAPARRAAEVPPVLAIRSS